MASLILSSFTPALMLPTFAPKKNNSLQALPMNILTRSSFIPKLRTARRRSISHEPRRKNSTNLRIVNFWTDVFSNLVQSHPNIISKGVTIFDIADQGTMAAKAATMPSDPLHSMPLFHTLFGSGGAVLLGILGATVAGLLVVKILRASYGRGCGEGRSEVKIMKVDSEKSQLKGDEKIAPSDQGQQINKPISAPKPKAQAPADKLTPTEQQANNGNIEEKNSNPRFLSTTSQIEIKKEFLNRRNPNTNQKDATSTKEKKPASNIIMRSSLDEFGIDLTELARKGELDPVAGRQSEIERVVRILSRRRKNNPCIIGDPGVGKTAIVEGLAQRIVQRKVPFSLQRKRVISIDVGLLLAGASYVGEFELRMTELIREVKESKEVILFFDEVHTLIGAGTSEGSNNDAADWLKPALARGELQCIGATTTEDYRKNIEKDGALERRFQQVKVSEPTVEVSVEILRRIRTAYEKHHNIRYTDEALVAAAKLSHRYISDRFLPDKAIDLIDEAAAGVRLRHGDQSLKITKGKTKNILLKVTEDDIQEALSLWTGIPPEKMSVSESDRLLNLEETLHANVVGQDEAVEAISRAIRRARAGLSDPRRPVASLIFAGPTGVGKTELAKALATTYFGSDNAMIRLDMSEFMEKSSVSKLVGAPPGYVGYDDGGHLTELVRRRPHSMILFDEIEKAHRDVFNMMLQIMDDGRLTDSQGRTVDFKNTMLIMTSNIGSHVINKGGRSFGFDLGYNSDSTDHHQSRVQSLVMEELKQVFRPEFLNRVDEIIVFRQLTVEEVKKIAELMLKDVRERLIENKKITELHVTEGFKAKLVEEGYDKEYGARALRRTIMRLLEDKLAEKVLAGAINEGDVVTVDIGSEGNVVVYTELNTVDRIAYGVKNCCR